jgi:glyoxylase-like metal-dependent hydrolase (beta-lactamase superfamily II)
MKSISHRTITITASLFVSLLAFNNTSHAETDFSYKKSEITDSITMLHGAGGNIAVLKGAEGLLVVDNGFDKNSDALTAALGELGEAPSFVLNTHWHGDHTGANESLGGSVIVAHQNVRERLAKGSAAPREIQPAASAALPDITYDSGTTIHFGDQTVTAVHYPKAHTDGDTVVFFEPAHVVHMGDMMFAGYFPYIDPSSGGSVYGYTKAVAAILERIDDTTIVMPGHGAIGNKADVQKFYDMIVATSATVKSMKDAGKTLEQAQAKGLSDKWQGWGDFFIDEARWISILWAG